MCETLAKISSQTNTWDKVLLSALFAYRTVNHDITHYEPFYLVYGRMARLLIELDIEFIDSIIDVRIREQIWRQLRQIQS